MLYFKTGTNNLVRNEVIASILLEQDYTKYQNSKYKVIEDKEDKKNMLYKIVLYNNEEDFNSIGKEIKIDPEYISSLVEETEENGRRLIEMLKEKIELESNKIIILGNFDRYGGIEIRNRNIIITISILYDSYGLIFKKKKSNEILYRGYDLEFEDMVKKIKKILE